MGGKASYDFQEKNHWRRWWVNRIADKCGGNRSELRSKVALFLCGQEGGEGEQLVEKGFSRNNVFAIDIDSGNTKKARQQGFPAITGDFCTAVKAWPHDQRLDAICADFCCPFNPSSFDLAIAILHSPITRPGLCIAINLMRGRDPEFGYFRNFLSQMYVGEAADWITEGLGIDSISKHRGFAWYAYLMAHFTQHYMQITGDSDGVIEGFDSEQISFVLARSLMVCEPKFYTYKSGNLCMDSVVFTWPFVNTRRPEEMHNYHIDEFCNLRNKRTIHQKRLRVNRRKIAAMRAVTTMQCK